MTEARNPLTHERVVPEDSRLARYGYFMVVEGGAPVDYLNKKDSEGIEDLIEIEGTMVGRN